MAPSTRSIGSTNVSSSSEANAPRPRIEPGWRRTISLGPPRRGTTPSSKMKACQPGAVSASSAPYISGRRCAARSCRSSPGYRSSLRCTTTPSASTRCCAMHTTMWRRLRGALCGRTARPHTDRRRATRTPEPANSHALGTGIRTPCGWPRGVSSRTWREELVATTAVRSTPTTARATFVELGAINGFLYTVTTVPPANTSGTDGTSTARIVLQL
jgi:hypothetical protein